MSFLQILKRRRPGINLEPLPSIRGLGRAQEPVLIPSAVEDRLVELQGQAVSQEVVLEPVLEQILILRIYSEDSLVVEDHVQGAEIRSKKKFWLGMPSKYKPQFHS
jgi:hypothetical protein